jgi:hypothetical protein
MILTIAVYWYLIGLISMLLPIGILEGFRDIDPRDWLKVLIVATFGPLIPVVVVLAAIKAVIAKPRFLP